MPQTRRVYKARTTTPSTGHGARPAASTGTLASLESDPEKQRKYVDFVDLYADLDDNERARYAREHPKEAQTMATFSERYIQQGIEQGIQQGRQEGIQEGIQQGRQQGIATGEQRVLLSQIQLKFGPVPEAIRARIEAADADTLLVWSGRILTATDLVQVFDDPA